MSTEEHITQLTAQITTLQAQLSLQLVSTSSPAQCCPTSTSEAS